MDSLEAAIQAAKSGTESMVKCLHHDDGNASVHVSPGTTQPVLITCHAGCELDSILAAAGLTREEIMKPLDDTKLDQGEWTPAGTASHVYNYVDEEGTLLFQTLRIPKPGGKKDFRQRHPHPTEDGKWVWNLTDVRRVLYRLPEVIEGIEAGRTIWIVEGEKDVETLRSRGAVATTSPMGAGKWRPEYTESLKDASIVTIVADRDETGRKHARAVKDELVAVGVMVSIVETAGTAKDITDHINAGFSISDLIETSPAIENVRQTYGIDVVDAINREFEEDQFVIPNLLARGDRLLITAFEGTGKSELLRQIAVQTAAGIHPFTGDHFDGKKVLYIDVENHPNQVKSSWRNLVGLAARHGKPVERGHLTILEEWDGEIDLMSSEGHKWLLERVHGYTPDLVLMGPLYNMSSRDLKDDEAVRKIKQVVNTARGICGSSFIMEHHAPHRNPADKERSVRPYGSSTFLKWPDFGYGLRPLETEGAYEWQKTRGPRVRGRDFPDYLRYGRPNTSEWPWTVAYEDEHGNIL
jgi:5S rRNA maturation endonuclease (ribonuclease M5)